MLRKRKKWKKCFGAGNIRKNNRVSMVIGVWPLEKGCGATQLSIMLANYLTAKEREHGAVVFQRKETLIQLCRVLGIEEKNRVTIKGMEFVTYEESIMSQLMNEGHQFILWCFDGKEEEQWEEFLRCNRHLVVCNLSEWHEERLETFVRENKKMGGFNQWKFLSSFGPKERFRDLNRKCGIAIGRIPWCEDPFSIRREWFSFLDALV